VLWPYQERTVEFVDAFGDPNGNRVGSGFTWFDSSNGHRNPGRVQGHVDGALPWVGGVVRHEDGQLEPTVGHCAGPDVDLEPTAQARARTGLACGRTRDDGTAVGCDEHTERSLYTLDAREDVGESPQ